MNAPTLRPLHRDDAPQVTRWLRDYLAQHRAWWRDAYGRAPSLPLEQLVARDWRELLAAAGSDDDSDNHWVRIAAAPDAAESTALGVARAAVRPDPFMGYPVGVLQWIYVDHSARGAGVADALMDAADAWMDASGAHGKQVFVTVANAAAVALYRRHGYRPIDYRMLAP